MIPREYMGEHRNSSTENRFRLFSGSHWSLLARCRRAATMARVERLSLLSSDQGESACMRRGGNIVDQAECRSNAPTGDREASER